MAGHRAHPVAALEPPVVLAAAECRQSPPALTRSEIHHLLNVPAGQSDHSLRHRLHWSAWWRTHQHRARISHYQKHGRT